LAYTSAQVCALTGATYRQLDYWARAGKLGRPPGQGSGGGRHRAFEPWEAVLVRACVLIVNIVPQGSWDVREVRAGLAREYKRDPTLTGWRLVVEPGGRAYIATRTAVPAAMVVNLATCAADVEARRPTVVGDPFPLFEETADGTELPTVDEWLAAGAPLREIVDTDPL
jgi:hypothetical protein